MIKSEQINELAAALSKAQGEFPVIPKNKVVDFTPVGKKPVYYRYADLADVISITAPILSKNGLSVSQDVICDEKGIFLETTIMHSSGQFKSGSYPLKICDRPQEQGSEITYARRYALTAALGIHSEEDTDGYLDQHIQNEVVKNEPKKTYAQAPMQNGSSRVVFGAR